MRNYSIFLILASLFCTSCNPDDGPLPLTPDLVTSVKAYDLDNNGNSSDIRVDFVINDNINVTEYRIMVIPSSVSNSFNESIAISIPRENFLSEFPVPFTTEYSINRLTSSLLDVNGGQIRNDIEYVVVVLVVGTGNHQLSSFSRPFTLKDQGMYAGEYEGFVASIKVKSTIALTQADKYVGSFIAFGSIHDPGGEIRLGEFSFIIETDSVKEFTIILNISCAAWLSENVCVGAGLPVTCTGEYIGSGIIRGIELE